MKKKKTYTSFKQVLSQITDEFLIIPYQGHYILYIKGELEGHYDTQDEALTALKNKGYNYY